MEIKKEEKIDCKWRVLKCPQCCVIFAVPNTDIYIGEDYPKLDKIKCYKCGYGANRYNEFNQGVMNADRVIKTTIISELIITKENVF